MGDNESVESNTGEYRTYGKTNVVDGKGRELRKEGKRRDRRKEKKERSEQRFS